MEHHRFFLGPYPMAHATRPILFQNNEWRRANNEDFLGLSNSTTIAVFTALKNFRLCHDPRSKFFVGAAFNLCCMAAQVSKWLFVQFVRNPAMRLYLSNHSWMGDRKLTLSPYSAPSATIQIHHFFRALCWGQMADLHERHFPVADADSYSWSKIPRTT